MMKRLSSPETPRKGRAGISTTCAPMEANATLTAPFDGLDRAPAESRQEKYSSSDLSGFGGIGRALVCRHQASACVESSGLNSAICFGLPGAELLPPPQKRGRPRRGSYCRPYWSPQRRLKRSYPDPMRPYPI